MAIKKKLLMISHGLSPACINVGFAQKSESKEGSKGVSQTSGRHRGGERDVLFIFHCEAGIYRNATRGYKWTQWGLYSQKCHQRLQMALK